MDEVIRDPAEYEHPHPAEWVSGACFAVRRSVLEEIGGLDESFFHYSEDVDVCARIWRSGHEVRFVPAALAEHEGGASAPRARLLPILAASRIRYSAKHDSRAGAARLARERGTRGGDARRRRAELGAPGAGTCVRSASRSGRSRPNLAIWSGVPEATLPLRASSRHRAPTTVKWLCVAFAESSRSGASLGTFSPTACSTG